MVGGRWSVVFMLPCIERIWFQGIQIDSRLNWILWAKNVRM